MAKTNITGHGQDYCGTRHCKGELCGGPAKAKRSPYESDLIGSIINQPIQYKPNNEEAKDLLTGLFERDEIADTLKLLSPTHKNALIADGDMKIKLQQIGDSIKSPKDLAELYQFLTVKKQQGQSGKRVVRIKNVEEKRIQGKSITIISLDDGSKLYHTSHKSLNDFKIIENEIEDDQAIEMTSTEFWDELYFQSSHKTQEKIKESLVELGLVDKTDGSSEIVEALYNSWNDVNEENTFDQNSSQTLKEIQKKCPELTTTRLAEIISPIRSRDVQKGFSDDGEDYKALIGDKPINWLFTDAFSR